MTRVDARDTKGRIVAEAFALFAERGYRGVSVRDIAAAVGIKDASLYNHFSGKQAIFDAVVDDAFERTREAFERDGVMFSPEDDPSGYAGAPAETRRRVLAGFRYFFEDAYMVSLRHLLTIAQFDDEGAAQAYRLIFIDRPQAIQRSVFEHLMATGAFERDDAGRLAREFYGPVFLLLSSEIPWTKAQPLICDHLSHFMAAHGLGAQVRAAASTENDTREGDVL